MKLTFSCLTLAAVLAMPLAASASTTTTLDLAGSTTINSTDYNIYDLKITTDSAWTNQRLDLSLTQGSIYQDSFGSNSQPNPLFFGIAPTLAYDTYFTIPQSYPNISSQGTAPGFAADNETSTVLGVSWFAPTSVAHNDPGTYVIAQITLTKDAVGSFSGQAFDLSAPGQGFSYAGTVAPTAVPEPASLAALALGGLALIARRKKA